MRAWRVLLAAVAFLAGTIASVVTALSSPAAPLGAARFVPLPPTRVLDTRSGLGGPKLGDNSSMAVQVAGVGGVPASGAVAVALNLTATDRELLRGSTRQRSSEPWQTCLEGARHRHGHLPGHSQRYPGLRRRD